MDWQVIILALIGISSAPMMAMLTHSYRRADRAEDYRRQDEIAARVRVVATRVDDVASDLSRVNRDVASKVAETAASLAASNHQITLQASVVNGKLDVIHTLVNSTLSAAIQAELDALICLLALMKDPSGIDEAGIANTERRIAELKQTVSTRDEQTRLATLQMVDNARDEGKLK